MSKKKKFTKAFRKATGNDGDRRSKALFAWWFSQLDVTDGQPFRNGADEQKLEDRLAHNLRGHFFHDAAKIKKMQLVAWLSAAVLAIAAGGAWYLVTNRPTRQQTFVEVATAIGERKKVTLSDGSAVTLNNKSSLRIPKSFLGQRREVFLSGEGFFEVKRNVDKPFVVRTPHLNVEVLGTSFDVRHFEAEDVHRVVVSTGKVEVTTNDAGQTWTLSPGELLMYRHATGEGEKATVNAADYTAWQNGRLVFRNERLDTICRELERWYGVNITITHDALKDKRMNLSLQEESLETMLEILSRIGDFDYQLIGKTVLLR